MSNNHSYIMDPSEPVTIRAAVDADARALRRLAGRDSARPIEGPALVALVGGELRAAISTVTGAAVSDPFHPSAALVEMLRVRTGDQASGWRTTGLRRAAAASSSRRTGVVYGAA